MVNNSGLAQNPEDKMKITPLSDNYATPQGLI